MVTFPHSEKRNIRPGNLTFLKNYHVTHRAKILKINKNMENIVIGGMVVSYN